MKRTTPLSNAVPVPAPRPINYFSIPRIRRNILIICALLLINKLGTPGNLICYGVLFAWAFRGPGWALKALSVSGLMLMASPFYVTHGGLVGPLKYLLLFVVGISLLRASKNPLGQPHLLFLAVFTVVAALLSALNDYFLAVSLLKLGSFSFGAFCILQVTQIPRNLGAEMTEWAFSLIVAAVLLSFAALAIGVGYGSVESIYGERFTGFRGMFAHPQSMGVLACMFAVYLSSLLLLVPFPHRRLAFGLLAGLFLLLYLSEARTGMLGYFLAMGLLLVFVNFSRLSSNERVLLRKYQRQFMGLAIAVMVALLLVEVVTGAVSERAAQFLKKGEEFAEYDLSTLYQSRSDKMEASWKTFKENPWIGIGFGTDPSIHWQRRVTLLSASSEKGFLPTAILEETGIIGTFFFALFVISVLSYMLRTSRYLGLAAFIALLVVNLGAMMFFAFGAMANLCWAMVGMAAAVSNMQIQQIGWRKRDV